MVNIDKQPSLELLVAKITKVSEDLQLDVNATAVANWCFQLLQFLAENGNAIPEKLTFGDLKWTFASNPEEMATKFGIVYAKELNLKYNDGVLLVPNTTLSGTSGRDRVSQVSLGKVSGDQETFVGNNYLPLQAMQFMEYRVIHANSSRLALTAKTRNEQVTRHNLRLSGRYAARLPQ